jgi:hypothetical protein
VSGQTLAVAHSLAAAAPQAATREATASPLVDLSGYNEEDVKPLVKKEHSGDGGDISY